MGKSIIHIGKAEMTELATNVGSEGKDVGKKYETFKNANVAFKSKSYDAPSRTTYNLASLKIKEYKEAVEKELTSLETVIENVAEKADLLNEAAADAIRG